MDASELRKKTDEDLRKELSSLRKEAFNLRMQLGTGQLARFTQIKTVRRDIARVKTILNERSKGRSA
jgi:large subunit ribosomal protein L29